jgi:hypothetical protein
VLVKIRFGIESSHQMLCRSGQLSLKISRRKLLKFFEKRRKKNKYGICDVELLPLANTSKLRQAEMELKKGQNMIDHEAEIYSRPARTWFQTGKEKLKAEGLSRMA